MKHCYNKLLLRERSCLIFKISLLEGPVSLDVLTIQIDLTFSVLLLKWFYTVCRVCADALKFNWDVGMCIYYNVMGHWHSLKCVCCTVTESSVSPEIWYLGITTKKCFTSRTELRRMILYGFICRSFCTWNGICLKDTGALTLTSSLLSRNKSGICASYRILATKAKLPQ